MKQICIITTTRADYGLLRPIILRVKESEKLDFRLIVSGTHLSAEHGCTISEILEDESIDNDKIDKIPIMQGIIPEENNTSRIMANALIGAGKYLKSNHPDLAIVFGDRFEMFAIAIAFANERIPLAHICGGETTEGALDELYRHCLTKLSIIHFPNCEEHRKRIIQMGENPDNIHNVGDTCVDNIVSVKLLPEDQIRDYVGAKADDRIIVVTYHPVTTEEGALDEFESMLKVIEEHRDYYYVFTKANADFKGDLINTRLEDFSKVNDNCTLVDSLGMKRYLSLLNCAECVIGNSSSGLTEAPLFHIPTINIGNRQKNRIHGETVCDCDGTIEGIETAFETVFSDDFKRLCKEAESIFGDGHAAEKIVRIIERSLENGILLKKKFYDIDYRK